MKLKKQYMLLSLVIFVVLGGMVFFLSKTDKNIITINNKQYYLIGNTLNLDSKGITDDELKRISQKIQDSQNLEILYFGGNKISKKGLEYLSSIKNDKLKVINLSNNNSGDEGMNIFLEKNSFKTIDVSGNNLTDFSVVNFSKNEKTSYLSINRNQISDKGFEDILKNKNLEYLSLENNLLTDSSIDFLGNMDNSKLKFLRLKGNKFTQDGIKKLDELKAKKVFETLEY